MPVKNTTPASRVARSACAVAMSAMPAKNACRVMRARPRGGRTTPGGAIGDAGKARTPAIASPMPTKARP
jgi:hypothetical protein